MLILFVFIIIIAGVVYGWISIEDLWSIIMGIEDVASSDQVNTGIQIGQYLIEDGLEDVLERAKEINLENGN